MKAETIFRWTRKYLFYAFPFVIIAMIWSSFVSNGHLPDDANIFIRALWELLSWNLIIWFVLLFLFFVSLIFFRNSREHLLARMGKIRERDEREEIIIGKASRASFFSTLSVLIFLLFLSLLTVEIRRDPNSPPNGQSKVLSLGLGFNFLEREVPATYNGVFESKNIPLTKTGIIVLILFWQVASFAINVRKNTNP